MGGSSGRDEGGRVKNRKPIKGEKEFQVKLIQVWKLVFWLLVLVSKGDFFSFRSQI